jgi:hypothetical protein
MPAGTFSQKFCQVAYGPSGAIPDCFGKTACDFYGDMTWGLRDGQLGPMLELLKAMLGLRVLPDGTMHLHGSNRVAANAVHPVQCTEQACRRTVSLPAAIATTFPAGLRLVELGGFSVDTHRNVSISVAQARWT